VTLAVYRSIARGAYFIAPAGLEAEKAATCRLSTYYRDHIAALSAMIEKQHEYNSNTEETGR